MVRSTSSMTPMKLRLWWRRLSVSSPTMTVKTQRPWPLRMAIAGLLLAMGGMMAFWLYGQVRPRVTVGESAYLPDQLARLQQQRDGLIAEREQLFSAVNAAESRLSIERSAQKQLALQVKTLESENLRLKEDLAFFDSLLPTATGPQGITIRRMKAEVMAPNQLRYRFLVMQGGRGDAHFSGSVQLAVSVLRDGKEAMMIFPDGNTSDNNKFKLGFRHYQRVEGMLTLPEGAAATLVQARVLEKGQLRAQVSANL